MERIDEVVVDINSPEVNDNTGEINNNNNNDNNNEDDNNNTNDNENNNNNDNSESLNDDQDNEHDHKKKSKNHKLKKRLKLINNMIKEADDIEKSYQPGRFEEVINGPRGPDVRLHRHTIIVGLLKLFLILFITAGIVLLTVIMLCITINVGYVCVQIDEVNPFIQLLFFAFYYDALHYITRSFWRTYLRSIHTIFDARFGASVNDIFVKRVLGYFFSLKIAQWTLPGRYQSHPKDWYEKVNLMVFVIFLLLISLPILLIAIFFGYWKVTGLVCLLFVGGGAITIVFLNLFSRFIHFIKFFRRLDEFYYNAPFFINVKDRIDNQTSYLRIAYCTTNGLDGGENIVDYVLDLLIYMILSIGVAAFIFGSFDPEAWKITLIVILLVIFLPIRLRKKIRILLVKMHILSRDKMKKKYEDKKKIVNAQMDATRKQYVDNKKASLERLNNQKKLDNRWSLRRLFSKNRMPSSPTNNANALIDNKPNSNIIQIQDQPSTSSHESSPIGQISNTTNDPMTTPISTNNPITNDINSYNTTGNKSQTPISPMTPLSGNSTNVTDADDESFYSLLQSDKAYIRHKTLLTWDINTIISWKGCSTVFICRSVKLVLGVTFMAFLNYHRYSVGSDETTTTNNLLSDIITHLSFIVLVLAQDIIYLIPMNSTFLSMKSRKFTFIILLVLELIFVILTRIFLKNVYIPMAFIVLAYANFTVYPDPRYTWDDEKVERKTFFDLFKPKIELRGEVSFNHFGKSRGYISKKSSKTLLDSEPSIAQQNSYKSNVKEPTTTTTTTAAAATAAPSRNSTMNIINDKMVVDEPQAMEQPPPPRRMPTGMELGGLNDEALFYEPGTPQTQTSLNSQSPQTPQLQLNILKHLEKRNNSSLYVDISGKNFEIRGQTNAKAELSKAIGNIQSEIQYKRNTRARYNSTVIMMVFAFIVFVSVVIGIIFARTTSDDYVADREVNLFQSQKPAICQWRGDGISINEFATLACACYYSTLDDIKYSWLYGRPKTSTNEFVIGEHSISSNTGVQYVDFENEEKNIIVVAIRGTSTAEDIFQDIYIWSASALLQLSGFFGTFIKFWPRSTIASLVKFIVKQFTNSQLLYWVDVEKHIMNLQQTRNATIYLTGHSLGGGVAGVISAHLNIPAITFSSPGLGYSYKTYDIELKNLINNFVNVVPMSDPVPLLDSQVGQIQNIECNTEQPLSCHSIFNTMETLNDMCHETSVYRYWDSTAEAKIDGEDIPHVVQW